jgi:hypothetical protein
MIALKDEHLKGRVLHAMLEHELHEGIEAVFHRGSARRRRVGVVAEGDLHDLQEESRRLVRQTRLLTEIVVEEMEVQRNGSPPLVLVQVLHIEVIWRGQKRTHLLRRSHGL